MTSNPASSGAWSAPGRVNLIGEHLDYHGGPVLPIAIDRRTRVTASVRVDRRVVVRSKLADEPVEFGTDTAPGEVEGWAAYVAGTVWAMRAAGVDVPGLDLSVRSDVPLGAGLSSSAALECAVAAAIRDLAAYEMDDVELALVAQQAENNYVGVPSGAMDQLASSCGVAGHALLIDTSGPTVQPVPAQWSDAGLTLVVIDTAASHELTDGGYATRRQESEAAGRTLGIDVLSTASTDDVERLDDAVQRRRARHVVTETARVRATVDSMADGDWARVGELFTASHVSLRDDYEVSAVELDVAVDTALAAGALGARMTGGGFGGSAIALVADERVDPLVAAVEKAFADRGFAAPTGFVVAPAAGAHRDRP
jgi:galactokinase